MPRPSPTAVAPLLSSPLVTAALLSPLRGSPPCAPPSAPQPSRPQPSRSDPRDSEHAPSERRRRRAPVGPARRAVWAFVLVLVATRPGSAQLGPPGVSDLLVDGAGRPSCTVQLQGGRHVDDRGDRNYYAHLTLTSPWGGCWSSSAGHEPTPRDRLIDPSAVDALADDLSGTALDPTEAPGSPRPDLEPEQWEDLELSPEELEDLAPEDWREWAHLELPRASASPKSRGSAPDGVLAERRTPPPLAKGAPPAPRRRSERVRPDMPLVTPELARSVARAALRAAGYRGLEAELSAAVGRARWSAALPDVRLRAARALDESARVDYVGDVLGDTRVTGRADVRLEAALTWRLSELVFSGREPSLARIRLTFLRQRQEVVRASLQALFRWQRTLHRANDPALLPEERAEALLDSVEAEVQLAVLTGGWFSAERALRSSHARAAPPIAPGQRVAPGVNEPRDAFRDAKQVDGPQKAR